MKVLDGKKLSEKILKNLAGEIKKKRLKLKLAVILVGDDFSSKVYIRKKREACEDIGIGFEFFKFSSRIRKENLRKEVKKIAKRADIRGIVVQLPLPEGFDSQEFLNLIPSEKDVDVLSEINIGKFYVGTLPISSPTTEGIRYLLKEYKISARGKNVVLVGAGRLVGRPLTLWLLKEKATISIVDEYTENISYFTKKADIIISGVGKPHLITAKMVKKGVVVIDVGTFRRKGRLVGDVEFKGVSKKASYITPIIGGVGPMTVACLLENLVKLSEGKVFNTRH